MVGNCCSWLFFLNWTRRLPPISYFVAYEDQKSKHNEHMVRENWEWDVHLASSVRATIFPFISFSLGVVANTNWWHSFFFAIFYLSDFNWKP